MSIHTYESDAIRATGHSDPDDLVITRSFDAPRSRVWKAWSSPQELMRWWGPREYTSHFCETDFRVGGTYLFSMKSPRGEDYWSTGDYLDIEDQRRIVYTDSFADDEGRVVPATFYGLPPNFPLEMIVSVSFDAQGGKTAMILEHAGLPSGEMKTMTALGWNESFDKLAEVVKS